MVGMARLLVRGPGGSSRRNRPRCAAHRLHHADIGCRRRGRLGSCRGQGRLARSHRCERPHAHHRQRRVPRHAEREMVGRWPAGVPQIGRVMRRAAHRDVGDPRDDAVGQLAGRPPRCGRRRERRTRCALSRRRTAERHSGRARVSAECARQLPHARRPPRDEHTGRTERHHRGVARNGCLGRRGVGRRKWPAVRG